ncbi:type II toxin-antitoxin system VapC family toxin [Rhizobium sp. 16-449-1b]|uniref:type II toxin-antitoxin system VapC family toxin n=1 Tax=Rhizobium sp. 16-449-1b TaxID=2819989 RepID=UPI001ADBB818|nr:type II toxin-antitoxin system VapC family toxin [Rhizobium sp. 16-449-1b]
MILLDTSLWIDHLRKNDGQVEFLLKRNQILVHPFVIGEIALGFMPRYDATIKALSELPQASVADNDEVLALISRHALMGSGIGYVDAHLLASVMLSAGSRLFTRDKRLARIATALEVGFQP